MWIDRAFPPSRGAMVRRPIPPDAPLRPRRWPTIRAGLIGGLALLPLMVADVSATDVSATSCTLRVGSEAPYPPFQTVDARGNFGGLEIDMLREIARRIGCDLDIQAMPWARILHDIQDGRLDIAVNAIETPERKAYAWFSHPYLYERLRLYIRAEDAGTRFSLPDGMAGLRRLSETLEPGTIGTINGYSFGPAFDALVASDPGFAAHLEPAYDYTANIRKLLAGHLAGFVGLSVTVEWTARSLGLENRLAAVDPPLDIITYHVMGSAITVDPARRRQINDAIDAMAREGWLARHFILGRV